MEQDMQNNNHGNSNWKDKLEDTAGFGSNELLDTNAAWDKLYNRMQQPRRKKTIWYWAAAASILTGIVFTILFSQQQQQTKPVNIVTTNPQKQTKELINTIEGDDKAAVVETGNKKKTINEKHSSKTVLQKSTVITEQKEKQLTAGKDDKIITASIPLLPVVTKLLNDTVSSTTIVSVQPKAKLKVVHVNELGNTNDNTNRPAVDYSVIQFGINSQRLYNKAPLPSGKIGLHISTNKISPSN